MKKALAIVFGLSLLVGIFVFKNRDSNTSATVADSKNSASVAATPTTEENRMAKLAPKATKGDASGGFKEKRPIVHTGVDFAFGENQNLEIVNGVMQLGNDAKFAPRLMPYKIFGIHVSQEIPSDTPIDYVVPELQSSRGEQSELTFEIRSKSADGTWSVWQEVQQDSKKPVQLEAPSVSWQYRLTFYANDPAQGPKVQRISAMPDQTKISPDPEATFSASNSQQ
jgi:hypothetical protein